MGPRPCDLCGHQDPVHSRFCGSCGARYDRSGPWTAGRSRYSALGMQIDPLEPTPRRDLQWVLIVLGGTLVIVGVIFLAVSALVSGAVSTGCAGSTCSPVDPGPWFLWIAMPLLGVGSLLLGVGLRRAFLR